MLRPLHLLKRAALLAMAWAAVFEIGLRLQQYFGPLYDLEMVHVNLDWESDVLNHVPEPQNQNMCIYGDLSGFSYKRSYDANGIRTIDDSAILPECQHPVSVLFLGDSFMEGYDDRNTLPYHVAKHFRTEQGICLKTYNAGYTSYSPSIFVPQAKKLLPIVRPDYVVVDVDETDFYDDFVRYRKLVVRNERGQNVGVKASPIGHECSVGLMEARKHSLYLMRLVAKLWLTLVQMPSLVEKHRTSELRLFSYSQDHGSDIEQKYSDAISVFRQNLQEMAEVLKDYTNDGRRVVCIFHPHLQHLKPDAAGRVWNDLVSSLVQEACVANNFYFFNATATLKQRFGSHPESLYWSKDDMHFNFKGLEAYSLAVAEFMALNVISRRPHE
jgi:lysophospholipase L1-like esterase